MWELKGTQARLEWGGMPREALHSKACGRQSEDFAALAGQKQRHFSRLKKGRSLKLPFTFGVAAALFSKFSAKMTKWEVTLHNQFFVGAIITLQSGQ